MQATLPSLGPHSRLRPVADLVTTRVDGELVIMRHEDEGNHCLDEVGGIIFQRLAPDTTIAQLSAALAQEFDAQPEVIEADVIAFLTTLLAQGLVEPVP